MKLQGKVWKLGNGIGATDIVPSRHDKLGMNRQWSECAKHVLEDVAPGLAAEVRPGDLIVAGERFGTGHAHYYSAAIMGCKAAGLGAFLAEGIGGLFQRGSIDFGMPAWTIPGIAGFVKQGQLLDIDLALGLATNLSTGATMHFKPVPPLVLDILEAGGSEPWALRRSHNLFPTRLGHGPDHAGNAAR